MLTEERGSVVMIEAEIKNYTPFGSLAYANPDTGPTITVTDPSGKVVVDGASMTNHDTGKYYYNVQTQTAWLKGKYTVEVSATFSSLTDISIDKESFYLE